MTTDLHKRLEEAADIYAKRIWNNLLEVHISKTDFLAGAELGYKEAIAEIAEWIETHGNISDNGDWHSIRLTELQAHMYKLLEDKK